jgi:predicted hotdog family 3-hydroxylacyl-ACP dehydratase
MSARAEFSLDAILPHRAPMRFVDTIDRTGPSTVESEWTVPPGSAWSRGPHLRRAAVLEFAAQTAAAHAGIDRLERGLAAAPGFLGGVDDFTFEGDAALGERLRCRVDLRFRMGNAVRAACVVTGGDGRVLARGEMSLVTAPDAAPELR